MVLSKRIGFVLLIWAASACGGLKEQLADTPQKQIAKLDAQLNDCRAESRRLKGEGGGTAQADGGVAAASPDKPSIVAQLSDTPQKQIESLNAQLAACEEENKRLREEQNRPK